LRRWIALVLVLALTVVAAVVAFEEVRPRASDYLALRRVRALAEPIASAARAVEVDPNLLAGLVSAESGGRVGARSQAGALGLCQLMPSTAAERALELGLAPPDEAALVTNAALNLRLGALHLRWCLLWARGDSERALVAYCAGSGRVLELERAAGGWTAWRQSNAGSSPLLAYAARVLSLRQRFAELGLFAGAAARPPESSQAEAAAPAAAPGEPAPLPLPSWPAPVTEERSPRSLHDA
jgi:soluble lytic murein transglycosylase-like protein